MSQTLPPNEDQEPGDPEWLRRMDGWEDTPDWLRKLLRSEERSPEPAPAKDEAEAEGALDFELVPAASVVPGESLVPEDEPDWLAELDAGEAEGALLPETEGDDIPDWLRRMSPLAEAKEPAGFEPQERDRSPGGPPSTAGWAAPSETELQPEAAPEAELPFAEEPDIPDWLRDLSLPDRPAQEEEREAPAWLAELDRTRESLAREPGARAPGVREPGAAGADLEGELAEAIGAPGAGQRPAAPAEPEEPDEEEELIPDWLLDRSASDEASARSRRSLAEEPEPAWGEDIEERLRQVGEAEQPAQELQVPEDELEALLAEEERPADQVEFPAWLVEMAEQPLPADEPVLAGPEEGLQDEPALPTVQEIVGLEPEELAEGLEEEPAEAVDWLYEEQEPPLEEPILSFAESELAQADMPEWLDELRVQEEKRAPDAVVETSGPLAGLSGLINPDPLFAITHRSVYVALPPTPDAQQEQARLLRTFLAALPKRPEVAPVVPGRAAAAGLGRWAIYVVLLAAIVTGMFALPLQGLIRPPRTAEGAAFFDAVSVLPQGSEVLVVIDYDASHDGELTPQARAMLWDLMNRGLGVVLVSHTPQGAAIVEDLLQGDLSGSLPKPMVAGEHYVNLGYMPAHAALLQAFIGNPLGGAALWGADGAAAQTPLGQRVGRFEDLDLILIVSSSQEHVRWWIEQTAVAGGRARIVAGASASAAPHLLPYTVTAGGAGIEGMLIGLAGAAEYEQLSGARFVPSARENLIMAGCAQLVLAAIVLASGIRSVFGRSRGA